MAKGHRPFKHILVLTIAGNGGIGTRYVKAVTKFGEKELVICSFRGAGILPSLDE